MNLFILVSNPYIYLRNCTSLYQAIYRKNVTEINDFHHWSLEGIKKQIHSDYQYTAIPIYILHNLNNTYTEYFELIMIVGKIENLERTCKYNVEDWGDSYVFVCFIDARYQWIYMPKGSHVHDGRWLHRGVTSHRGRGSKLILILCKQIIQSTQLNV